MSGQENAASHVKLAEECPRLKRVARRYFSCLHNQWWVGPTSVTSTPTMSSPIIVITGTPGTGKSTHAQLLVQESPLPLTHINIGNWVKEKGLHSGYDQQWESYNVDEDKVSPNPLIYHMSPYEPSPYLSCLTS